MNANFESHSISRRSFLKASGVVGAASILAACGGSSSSTAASTSGAASGAAAPAADAITDYVSFETANRELETWNFLYSQSASDLNVTTNCWDGLLSFDCYGKAVPAIASSWEHNEDSTVWTFHLRDDVDWVDCNGEVKEHITATDFLVGLEWVLNASKNEANNTSMPTLYIVGAEEYYEKTKDMGAAAADLRYQDMLDAGVGIEAPDDYTLVFTCKDPCPYFDTVASYTSFYPASQVLIDELGIEGRTIGIAPVGCSVLAYNYFTCDMIEASHGRAPAVATGVKRSLPDNIVFTYQGDGDLASIGLCETVSAAARGENITVIFINNAIYGMTGGQMAPTSLPGQITQTSPYGRDVKTQGYPIRICELLATLDAPAYLARVTVNKVKNVKNAKACIKKAFENQIQGKGFSLVEVLSACPTNWGLEPQKALEWIDEKMIPYYPLGVYRDKEGEANG